VKGETMKREKVPGRHRENGIALITTLLLLMLLTGMVAAMVIATNSDMLINGYYRDYRGGFYAADSGLAIVRQSIANQMLAAVPDTFPPATQPIPPGTEGTVLSNVKASYGAAYTSINSGQNSSWPATFQLDSNQTTLAPAAAPLNCTVTGGAPGASCTNTCPTGCTTAATIPQYLTYTYNYHLLMYGRARGLQKTTLEESGSLVLKVPLTPAGVTNKSFAAWGMFIDAGTICDGSTLVPGTISGPVFTNGAWNFSTSGQYIFTDTVGSHSAQEGYQFSGSCDQSAGVSDTKSGTTIAPSFAQVPKWGQNKVPLPTNDYNQQRAVLDGVGTAGQPSNSDRNSDLRGASQGKYPSTGASSGVYLPYSVTAGVATFTGGGILVEGNASVILSASGTSAQVYTIKQGTTTTTITVNNASNTTTVSDTNGNNVTIAGVPEQRDPVTNSVISPATMLYVDGNITSLSSTGQGVAAIQDGTALTITASGSVAVTGDILYKTEPVTLTQNQIPNTPADTLIPGNDKGQALGIFTATGDIQLNNLQSNGNLEIDASLATISASGSGGLINVGNTINKLTIVGGRIQNQMKNIGATTRNVYFDRRYANGVAPPWFPSTSISNAGMVSGDTSTSIFQRLQWVNRTAYQ
jgi:Tfp pilus assembly protein PilX